MKKNSNYLVDILFITIPFVYGYLVNTMVFPIYPFIMQLVFIGLWFYVGMRFSRWNLSKWKSFLIGNSLWLISFALFVWQFILLDDISRNIDIAGLAQFYMLPFVYGTAKILPFLYSGTMLIIWAYLLMLATFSIGFHLQKNSYAERKLNGSELNKAVLL